jgi:hypothetical protein
MGYADGCAIGDQGSEMGDTVVNPRSPIPHRKAQIEEFSLM